MGTEAVVTVFNQAAFVSDVSSNTAQLNQASASGDTAVVVSSLAGLAAAFPGPQQVGAALVNAGLAPLPAGVNYSSTGSVKPSQIVAMATAGAGLFVAVAAAAGVTTVAGISVAAAAPVIGLVSALNGLFPEVSNQLYNEAADLFARVASGEALESVLDDFGNWWLETVLPFMTGDAEIYSDVSSAFQSALNFIQRRDPLTLDLDGDGIETVSANSGITFDFDGDGLKTGTGWVKGDDGFLVLDRNSNGTIDTGRELFGVDTVKSNGQKASDGFDALRDLDGNADGVFDAQDAQFANVCVWQDANQDGVAQASELKTLAEHNITAINLGSTQTSQNSNGNIISATGSFVRGDGTEGPVIGNQSLAANLDLAANPFYREYTDSIALDEVAKALPDMQGSGAVRDLREASMLNAGLKSVECGGLMDVKKLVA